MLKLREIDIEVLKEISDYNYNIEDSIATSKEILEEIMNENSHNSCEFESNNWRIFHNTSNTALNFDFNKISENITFIPRFNNQYKKEFLIVIKCWVASLLNILDIYSVHRYMRYLKRIIKVSEGFNPIENSINATKEYILKIEKNEKHSAFITCIGVINFLDYYNDIDKNETYTKLFFNLKQELGTSYNVRTLPPPKDVFLFDKIVNDYFKSLDRNSYEYIFYFPIYLWWNITNIIPLRPFEFCGIERSRLPKKEGKFYIKLPRSTAKGVKGKNKNRIQIIDTLMIPNHLGLDIEQYIDSTNQLGETKTLLSYNACRKAHEKLFDNKLMTKSHTSDSTIYTINDLFRLINKFYDDIVGLRYGYSVRPRKEQSNLAIINKDTKFDITDRISPGDTRHFAFLNLMRQGYNPIEIARMGGHTKINSQYHYHQHKEFLIDIDILKLMSKFSYESNFKQQNPNDNNSIMLKLTAQTTFDTTYSLIKDKFVRVIPESEESKNKLDIGVCTDPFQLCKVHDCMLCDYWKISASEYKEKKNTINQKAQGFYNNIEDIQSTINSIYSYIINECNKTADADEFNFETNRDLVLQSKQLSEAIDHYVRLMTMETRGVIIKNE